MDSLDYYWLTTDSTAKSVAYAPKGLSRPWELFPLIIETNHLPFRMIVHSVDIKEKLVVGPVTDQIVDYQPNSLSWPLMSQTMKQIINTNLNGNEGIVWKSVILQGKTNEYEYYIPMFTKYLDTLDKAHTIFAPPSNIVIKPVFMKQIVNQYAVFHGNSFDWKISSGIYVDSIIKKELESAHLKGLSFSKVKVL